MLIPAYVAPLDELCWYGGLSAAAFVNEGQDWAQIVSFSVSEALWCIPAAWWWLARCVSAFMIVLAVPWDQQSINARQSLDTNTKA